MTEFDMTNRGSLFKNDRKEKDTHPDYRGTINVDGREFWLSGWLKTGRNGQKFFSLSLKPKDAPMRDKIPATSKWAEPEADPYDDPVPF